MKCVLVLLISPVPAFAGHALASTQRDWTYLVYLAADNNLDAAGQFSMDLIKKGMESDKDDNINFIVLYDHFGAGAELLRVTQDGVVQLPEPDELDMDEPDTGDPETLHQFLSWGVNAYPAEHYVVVIWDHGGGWKYIIKDGTSGTRMPVVGLADAMKSVTEELGIKFDITLFDACLMALVEVAYQLKPVTDYVVASEHALPLNSFPYDLILQRLIDDTSVPTWNYAKGMIDDYYTFYEKSSAKSHLSVCAIDESKLDTLITSIDDFSISLISIMDQQHGEINSARSNSQHQSGGGINGVFWYVDLHVFAEEIIKRVDDMSLNDYANAVMDAQSDAVYERHSNNVEGSSYGLAINFPPNLSRYKDKSYLTQDYQEMGFTFTDETNWDEMLLEFYNYEK